MLAPNVRVIQPTKQSMSSNRHYLKGYVPTAVCQRTAKTKRQVTRRKKNTTNKKSVNTKGGYSLAYMLMKE